MMRTGSALGLALLLAACATVPESALPREGATIVTEGPLRPSAAQLALTAEEVQRVRAVTGDGASAESALVIGRIDDAYLWLRDRGFVFQRHEVERVREQVFDVLTAQRRGGASQRFVFALVPDTAADQRIARAVRRVMTSGDGQDFATAFAAPSVPVEYEVLRLLGLQRARQALVRRDGQAFDVLSVVDPADGARREVYFRLPADPAQAGVASRA